MLYILFDVCVCVHLLHMSNLRQFRIPFSFSLAQSLPFNRFDYGHKPHIMIYKRTFLYFIEKKNPTQWK